MDKNNIFNSENRRRVERNKKSSKKFIDGII